MPSLETKQQIMNVTHMTKEYKPPKSHNMSYKCKIAIIQQNFESVFLTLQPT
jgi:hypothetical protein